MSLVSAIRKVVVGVYTVVQLHLAVRYTYTYMLSKSRFGITEGWAVF